MLDEKYQKDDCYDYKTAFEHDVKMLRKKGIKEVLFVHPNDWFISVILKNNQKYTINGVLEVKKAINLFNLSMQIKKWRCKYEKQSFVPSR